MTAASNRNNLDRNIRNPLNRNAVAASVVGLLALVGPAVADPRATDRPAAESATIVLAQQEAAPAHAAPPAAALSPEEKMNRRFPQKVKVGDLIGLPVLDDDDVTLGHVTEVVRTPEDKIKLIVSYSRWFGWFGRPVAVPIEVVAILAKQIASIDMEPDEYAKAPTWMPGTDRAIPTDDIIRIAVTRR